MQRQRQDFFRFGSGTERTDDLCFFHNSSSQKNFLFYFIIFSVKYKPFFKNCGIILMLRADCAAAAYPEYDEESPGIAGQDA